MPPVLRTRALLLRSVDFAEADRVVTLLTEERGKLALMARGARRSRRRFGGALEPFALLQVEFSHGRGALGSLSAARIERGFVGILASLSRMQVAGRALDTLRGLLLDGHPEPELFAATVDLLAALDSVEIELLEQWRLGFLGHALYLLGVAPSLRACGACGRAPRATQPVQLDPVRGHLVCQACGGAALRLGPRSRQLLQALSGPEWHAATAPAWPELERDEVSQVIAAALRVHATHAHTHAKQQMPT